MKHCPECGAGARREGAKFCEECGFELASESAAVRSAPIAGVGPAAVVPDKVPDPSKGPVVASGQEPALPSVPDTVTLSLPPRPLMWAATVLLFSAFFPWLTSTARIDNAMGIPTELLWNQSAATGGFALGWVLIILAVLVTVSSTIRSLSGVRRLLGVVAMFVPIAVMVQWSLALDSLGSADSWLSYVGVGAYATLAAGAIVAFTPKRGA